MLTENKHTKEDLKIMQSWPLERKIQVTQTRIIEWYLHWQGKVYISFSGGKDSTVLLDLARRAYPDIEAVFIDTGLEYPEIRDFVKTKDNVTWIHPIKYDRSKKKYVRTNFKEVIAEYGYPVISKEVSNCIHGVRINSSCRESQKFNPDSQYLQRYGARYDLSKWKYLLDAPFKIDGRCCNALKKSPVKKYEKETGNKPILGTLASESAPRRNEWLKVGCNGFDKSRPISQPLSFWTEQDILKYLLLYKIPYCEIYGDIVNAKGKLRLTGVERTGCMFCMLGAHLDKKPNRFQRMKTTHPKQYEYCMKDVEQGGLGLRKVLDYIGVSYE